MSTLFGVPVDAVYHIVFALTNLLTPVLGGLAAVAGIVVITAAFRLLVTPLTFRALRGQAAQARLAPELQRLRQRFGKQPERLQSELTALYRREGTSMFAGFAPLLAQWPVFSVLYLLFRSPSVAGGPNRLLSRDLLGVPLGSHWLSGAGPVSVHDAVFVAVLALLAAACWLAARTARSLLPPPSPVTATAADGTATPQALTAVTKVLPYLTVVIAAFAPLAGAIYLITSTGWSAAERRVFAARAARTDQRQAEIESATAARPTPGRAKADAARADAARVSRQADKRPQTSAASAGQNAGLGQNAQPQPPAARPRRRQNPPARRQPTRKTNRRRR